MIINTFSYLWSTTAISAMTELVENGYKTFEVPISSPHCWPEEISDSERSATKAKLDGFGASIRSLNAGGYDINLASPGANMRRKSIEHVRSVIDLAVAWDVPDVVISPGTRRPMKTGRLCVPTTGRTGDSLGKLRKHRRKLRAYCAGRPKFSALSHKIASPKPGGLPRFAHPF